MRRRFARVSFLGCVVDNHPESKSPVKNVTPMSLANE